MQLGTKPPVLFLIEHKLNICPNIYIGLAANMTSDDGTVMVMVKYLLANL